MTEYSYYKRILHFGTQKHKNVWDVAHPRVIDFALRKAREFVKSMPPSSNAGRINLRVRPEHRHFFEETLGIRMAARRSMEEAEDGLVPVVESFIESLASTSLTESGSCATCLEEFGNGGEGVMIPCSHIFHGDCIKKWLRTSHYCPVCRFDMPTH